YQLELRRTGYRANDAYTAYLEMGAPQQLDDAQLARLQSLTLDRPESVRTVTIGKNGLLDFTVPMHSNDIALLTLQPVKP
ncbi:MAG TPA: beta-xylosidase, partial [Burkholderiaceae bacterium]